LRKPRYYLILADDLGYGCRQPLIKEIEQVSKLLEAYALSVHHNNFPQAPEF
jgi:hypothetical protein